LREVRNEENDKRSRGKGQESLKITEEQEIGKKEMNKR